MPRNLPSSLNNQPSSLPRKAHCICAHLRDMYGTERKMVSGSSLYCFFGFFSILMVYKVRILEFVFLYISDQYN